MSDPVVLGEYEGVERCDLVLTERDQSLAVWLRAGDGRLAVDDLKTGVRIRASSWVGVVRFERFEVHVVPKYARENLGVLQMLGYTRGLDALVRAPAVRQLALGDANLVDLVCLLLAEEAGRLVRDGLLQDYVEREDTLPMIRGRLLPFEQVTRHFGRVDRLEVRYEEFEADIEENRLIAAALEVANRATRHHTVRRELARVLPVFEDACDASLLGEAWLSDDVEYTRRSAHYQPAHTLARILLRDQAVRDVFAAGVGRSWAFLIDMNRLFEDFVTYLLIERLTAEGFEVKPQARDRSLLQDLATGHSYGTVIPDVLVRWRDPGGAVRRLPVDAKYKLLGDGRIDAGDLYQLFFYAYAYGAGQEGGQRRSLILYPSHGERRTDVGVRDVDGVATARVTAIGVDLVRILEAMDRGEPVPVPAIDEILSAAHQEALAA